MNILSVKSLVLITSIACSTHNAFGQSLVGQELEIGLPGSNQVSGVDAGAAIGFNNSVTGQASLAVGGNNLVHYMSMAVGQGNSHLGGGGATIGSHNSNYGSGCLIAGRSNMSHWSTDSNFLTGWGNYADAFITECFVAGTNNWVGGGSYQFDGSEYYYYGFSAMFALGRGLYNHWDTSVVVGRYNDASMPDSSGVVFVIGNGADANNRSNAMEVYADGKILIPRQGDILMGEFGNQE